MSLFPLYVDEIKLCLSAQEQIAKVKSEMGSKKKDVRLSFFFFSFIVITQLWYMLLWVIFIHSHESNIEDHNSDFRLRNFQIFLVFPNRSMFWLFLLIRFLEFAAQAFVNRFLVSICWIHLLTTIRFLIGRQIFTSDQLNWPVSMFWSWFFTFSSHFNSSFPLKTPEIL